MFRLTFRYARYALASLANVGFGFSQNRIPAIQPSHKGPGWEPEQAPSRSCCFAPSQ